ncbi:restriction endonuclease subunit S [Megasphaera lornae]|uniref:Type I restriction modification DNA specificity domain protein n=1 Tax=Megasphaera lornae TaxID=1000568 RepID=A0ABN0D0Z9_9FIRM|nr:restriction endonuclease subunit S [Megasphaera lornae]EGL41825.1 type I restriction modification DNA specificity domain protein [Megasphaera lornae]
MSYKEELLGDYIDILSGFAFKTKDFVDNGVPIIKIKNISPPCVTLDDLTYVSNEVAEKQKKFMLSYDDVLIAMTGSHINQWTSVVGRVARVKYSDSTLLNQRVGKITIKANAEADINYIYYYLSQDAVKIKLAAKAGGAANQANISPAHIKGLSFPCPDLAIQKKIGNILKSYDDLIENNQKQIKLLEEAARRLYKEWFVDLHFPGYEDVEIVDGVPEGWTFGVLGDVAINSGKKEKKEKRDNYKYYLPIDCIPKKSLGYIQVNDVSLAKSSLIGFQKGDIIFGAMRPYFHKVVVARDKGLTRTTCFVLNAKDPSYWSYLAMLLFTKDTVDYATQISVGTTMPYVRWNDMRNMPVIIPDLEIAERFNKQIQPIIDNIASLSEQVILLQQARDRLSPKLMSGEIEV